MTKSIICTAGDNDDDDDDDDHDDDEDDDDDDDDDGALLFVWMIGIPVTVVPVPVPDDDVAVVLLIDAFPVSVTIIVVAASCISCGGCCGCSRWWVWFWFRPLLSLSLMMRLTASIPASLARAFRSLPTNPGVIRPSSTKSTSAARRTLLVINVKILVREGASGTGRESSREKRPRTPGSRASALLVAAMRITKPWFASSAVTLPLLPLLLLLLLW